MTLPIRFGMTAEDIRHLQSRRYGGTDHPRHNFDVRWSSRLVVPRMRPLEALV